MKRLLRLCDADTVPGETLQPIIFLGLCIVSKKVEPAGRSFLDKYETRVDPKNHRKKSSSPTSHEDDEESPELTETWKAKAKNRAAGGRFFRTPLTLLHTCLACHGLSRARFF